MTYPTECAPLSSPDRPITDRASCVDELPFHRRALATPRHRWWRPIITVLASGLVYAVLMMLVIVTLVLTLPSAPIVEDESIDMSNPWVAMAVMIVLALMIPALAIGLWLGERRTLGSMTSVAGRLRLRLLGRYGLLALGCVGLSLGIAVAFDLATGAGQQPSWSSSSLGLLACAMFLVPFQAAAEEYVFRGLPQQVLGSWVKTPWWGILAPVPLFVIGHDYDLPGQLSVAVFAIVAGILTWRTGGLEAAIALHIVNNALIFVLGAIGLADLNATTGSWPAFAVDLAGIAVYSVVVLRSHAADQAGR